MKNVNIFVLAIINSRIDEIKNLDGSIFDCKRGYEPKEIVVPKLLENKMTQEILEELGVETPLTPEDINFKRYKGLPIIYINNHRDFNGQFGFGFPVTVTMRMRTTEEYDAILDAEHKLKAAEHIDGELDYKDNSQPDLLKEKHE